MQKLNFSGEKVIVRVDFNVPMDENHQITDDTRIRGAIPTLRHILDKGGSIVLLSHLGRPLKKLGKDGEIQKDLFSMKHVVDHLSELLGEPVQFAEDCLGEKVQQKAKNLKPGEVLLVENTRFYPGEEKGDPDMAKQLASLGTLYVNDAFGTAHRAHASTAVIAKYFAPEKRAFGLLMQAELDNAARTMDHPDRPLLAIVGGAKVSDKILLLSNLLEKVDTLIIGGGMAFTFIKAQGGEVGKSLVEEDRIPLAKELLEKAKAKKVSLLLPSDSVIADRFEEDAQTKTVQSHEIPDQWMGLDIGPDARDVFTKAIAQSKTILWNGPMGVFEMPAFSAGTKAVALAVADATKKGAFSLVGGGDSVNAVNQLDLSDQISFVSTGGGAMLELLEGKELPGVTAILGGGAADKNPM